MSRQIIPGRGGRAMRSILLLSALTAGCSEEQAPPPEQPPRPVRSLVVAASDGSRVLTYSGTAKADVEADISFRVSGTVSSRPVNVGDTVASGAVLATLDTRDFTIRVREAEAQLANARAALRNAQSNYDRARNLYENDNVSRSDLDAARAAAESASAQVRIGEQNLANSRLQLSYTRLLSPDDCDIAETIVKENENVTSGQTIVRLNCGDCAEVRVSVPETQISAIALGDAATVSFAALPGETFMARVTEVGVAMASDGSSFPVVVKVGSDCDKIRPGMAADVRFVVGQHNGTQLIVPIVAVGEDRDGRHVYVLEQVDDTTWRARRRAVVAGQPQTGGMPVLEGLQAGERIVTAGVRRIGNDQLVRLYNDAP